jgi:predicted DNA-binding protein (UPF0251 family)
MGSGPTRPIIPDLFSTREQPAPPTNPPIPATDSADSSPRHVLPSDLPAAIKHLNDQELQQLLAAVTAEQQRRGKKPSTPKKTISKQVETPAVTLTIGKLNAVRAAFKAGVRPSKIAKQFGISQSEVRKVLASKKEAPT